MGLTEIKWKTHASHQKKRKINIFPNAFLLSAVLSWLSVGRKLCCDTVTVCGYAPFVCWHCEFGIFHCKHCERFLFLLIFILFCFVLFSALAKFRYRGYTICGHVCAFLWTPGSKRLLVGLIENRRTREILEPQPFFDHLISIG